MTYQVIHHSDGREALSPTGTDLAVFLRDTMSFDSSTLVFVKGLPFGFATLGGLRAIAFAKAYFDELTWPDIPVADVNAAPERTPTWIEGGDEMQDDDSVLL